MSEKRQDTPFSHRLTDKDEKTKQCISTYLKTILMSTLMSTLAIRGVLAIYWVRANSMLGFVQISSALPHRALCGDRRTAYTT